MGALRWVAALARRRPERVLGAAAGVALAVALLGSLGAFLASAKAQMTQRAVRQVAVDWQVEVQPGADPAAVLDAVSHAPGVRAAVPVGMGSAPGFEARSAGAVQTVQTTGPGVVVGLPPGYRTLFPGQVRTLAGADEGVLLAQQTAANLHAGPGDTVVLGGVGPVVVAGVVDLPQADSLFQKVGAPPGAQATAPPDNVLLLPLDQWRKLFPDGRTQVHARLDHRLPPDPAAAFTRTVGAAHRVEADLAGAGVVGDNLAATLDAARKDALYAEVLFILLGLPGAALAALLTRAVAVAGRDRRRRELALLRARGATVRQLQRLAGAEAAAVAVLGSGAGLLVAAVVGRAAFGSFTLGATGRAALVWAGLSVAFGSAVAIATVALPARREAASVSVAAARQSVGRAGLPRPLRYGLDGVLLAAAGLLFWASSRTKYNLVLAPEGVPTVSVNYWALAAPLLFSAGTGLLVWRVVETLLGRGGRVVRALVRPIAGRLSGPVASSLGRQRRALAAGVVLTALTVVFALSTAVFNTTYRQQVAVDALLTNGADVTVTATGPVDPARLAAVPGVKHVEPMQHRFVYVGADLQDMYGVDPNTIGSAGRLQDAYFNGGSARDVLARLRAQPDAALFSAETVADFQLHLGDRLRLRVRQAGTGKLVEVPFRYAGVAKEFPTAPTDSFVVANSAYVAAQTGDQSVNTWLLDAAGPSPRVVADRVRRVVGAAGTVTDIETSRRVVGSSLTAVDLAGLTKVELGYALVL
ncbi:MAG TPA: ABC transporter permease, partial [Acidimicrobiales bacterium]|nr:ABC transporter permease [Acidimicrobiales bacterium]